MLDITQLDTPEYVLNNLLEVCELYEKIDSILENLKTMVKDSETSMDLPTVEIRYSSYNKMVPVNIDNIMERYPISEYPDCYNISLSAKAGDIIMEPELIEYKPVKVTKFISKE
jgi:hypothetical protein